MMFEWFLFFLYTHILFTQCRITAWTFAVIPSPNQMLWEQSLSICRVSTGPCTQADKFPAPSPDAWAQQPELVSSAAQNIPFSCFLSSTNSLSADLLMSHIIITCPLGVIYKLITVQDKLIQNTQEVSTCWGCEGQGSLSEFPLVLVWECWASRDSLSIA